MIPTPYHNIIKNLRGQYRHPKCCSDHNWLVDTDSM